MNNINKILVPVDFSESSKKALNYISGFTKEDKGIEVTLLHISSGLSEEARGSVIEQLESLKEQWSVKIPLSDYRVESGELIGTILKVQLALGPDLIVMGTAGSMDENEGTNTSKLVLEVDCPVLVIPESAKAFAVKNIALALGEHPIDNSGGLQVLHDIARAFNSKVHVLTINRDGANSKMVSENQDILDYFLESLLYFHAFPQNSDIEKGISDYVTENDIDMLAILPRNHAQKTTPSEGRLTKLLTMHTQVPLLTID